MARRKCPVCKMSFETTSHYDKVLNPMCGLSKCKIFSAVNKNYRTLRGVLLDEMFIIRRDITGKRAIPFLRKLDVEYGRFISKLFGVKVK